MGDSCYVDEHHVNHADEDDHRRLAEEECANVGFEDTCTCPSIEVVLTPDFVGGSTIDVLMGDIGGNEIAGYQFSVTGQNLLSGATITCDDSCVLISLEIDIDGVPNGSFCVVEEILTNYASETLNSQAASASIVL